MTFAILSALMKGIWAIDPVSAERAAPLLSNILKGEQVSFLSYKQDSIASEGETAAPLKLMSVSGQQVIVTRDGRRLSEAPEGSIAMIPVNGTIIKGDACAYGTKDYTLAIQAANNNSNIDAIILEIDSPGGMVDGTATFADAIKNSKKPVVAFIDDGMMASAAYWIGSAADVIIASHNTSQAGSIGVYTTLMDIRGAFEEQGVKIKSIYAPESTEKNGPFIEAMEKDNDKLMEQELSFIAQEFISTVKTNRAGKINLSAGDPFKGKLFYAQEAIEVGLIDKIGSFEVAVQTARELTKKNQSGINISI